MEALIFNLGVGLEGGRKKAIAGENLKICHKDFNFKMMHYAFNC